jgi:hypothetical protein
VALAGFILSVRQLNGIRMRRAGMFAALCFSGGTRLKSGAGDDMIEDVISRALSAFYEAFGWRVGELLSPLPHSARQGQ